MIKCGPATSSACFIALPNPCSLKVSEENNLTLIFSQCGLWHSCADPPPLLIFTTIPREIHGKLDCCILSHILDIWCESQEKWMNILPKILEVWGPLGPRRSMFTFLMVPSHIRLFWTIDNNFSFLTHFLFLVLTVDPRPEKSLRAVEEKSTGN